MTVWEYDHEQGEPEPGMTEVMAGLNARGADGWELVWVVVETNRVMKIYKRPRSTTGSETA